MNLTRLRKSHWLESLMEYYKEYKLRITWGDQDLINIYFHFHPGKILQITRGLVCFMMPERYQNIKQVHQHHT
jgi:hypothetical protein